MAAVVRAIGRDFLHGELVCLMEAANRGCSTCLHIFSAGACFVFLTSTTSFSNHVSLNATLPLAALSCVHRLDYYHHKRLRNLWRWQSYSTSKRVKFEININVQAPNLNFEQCRRESRAMTSRNNSQQHDSSITRYLIRRSDLLTKWTTMMDRPCWCPARMSTMLMRA